MPYRFRFVLPSLLVLIFTLSACTTQPPARQDWTHGDVSATYPVKPNTGWVASAGWRSIAEQRYAQATRYIVQQSQRLPKGSWAVALDIDQTVLDNIDYHLMQDRKGAPFTPETWRDWIEQREAKLVPGAKAFIARVNALGGHVALVTNRRSYEEEATIDNLAKVGLVKGRDYAVLFTYAWPNGVKAKDGRYIEVERVLSAGKHHGVRTIAYVGDQSTDKPVQLGSAHFFCIPQGNLYGKPCEFEK